MRKNYEGNTGGGGVKVPGYFEGNDWGYYGDGGKVGWGKCWWEMMGGREEMLGVGWGNDRSGRTMIGWRK